MYCTIGKVPSREKSKQYFFSVKAARSVKALDERCGVADEHGVADRADHHGYLQAQRNQFSKLVLGAEYE